MSVFQQQQEAQNIDVYVWQVITEMDRNANYVIYLPYNRISFFYEHWSVDDIYLHIQSIWQKGQTSFCHHLMSVIYCLFIFSSATDSVVLFVFLFFTTSSGHVS